jgi:hypothetical protein
MITVNESTEIEEFLQHVDPVYWDIFCDAWYAGLTPYKDYPESLMLVANAILNHWEIPLYTEDVSWDDTHACFVWHLVTNKQRKGKK